MGGVDWEEYLRLVDRHRTPALSWAALKCTSDLQLPAKVQIEMQQRADRCRRVALRHIQLLTPLLRAFQKEDISVLCFKGPMLSDELYGDIGLRHSKDIDLQVREKDLSRVQVCLEGLGYHTDSSGAALTPREWAYYRVRDHQLDFVPNSGAGLVEIHWRNQWETPQQSQMLWNRASPSNWHGLSFLTMHREDRLLYLCSHGAEHVWSRAKWLGDLARIMADGELDWTSVLRTAQATHQDRALLASLLLVSQCFGLPLPSIIQEAADGLHATLLQLPVAMLCTEEEAEVRHIGVRVRDGFRCLQYRRLLLPQHTWQMFWQDLTFSRRDFWRFRLADSHIWLYSLLRPVLWLGRRMKRARKQYAKTTS